MGTASFPLRITSTLSGRSEQRELRTAEAGCSTDSAAYRAIDGPIHPTAQKIPGCGATASGRRFESHAVALTFKRLQGAPGNALAMVTVIVVGAGFAIDRSVGQDVIHDT